MAKFPGLTSKDPLKKWNELPETIIEAANTEAFKLALRARPGPIEHLNTFYFYITSTNSLHCFFKRT